MTTLSTSAPLDLEALSHYTVLAINTGSTSTKVAVYRGTTPIVEASIAHSTEEISRFSSVPEQYEWRKEVILETLLAKGFDINTLSAVIGRGGLLHPIESGVYEVNEQMLNDLRTTPQQHASNLGAMIASEIASLCQVKAYIADPVVVDERDEVARFTGIKQIQSRSIFHALNQKATARRYADDIGRCYEDMNLVVAHMGGGISVAAHRKGKVVDCNNALDGDGPIAPERAGTIPAGDLIDLCYSGEYSHKQARELLVGKGGLVSLTGSNAVKGLVEQAEAGDKVANDAINAMTYGVIKYIGQMAAVLRGEVDAVLLTGGIAHSKRITDQIRDYCRFIAPVEIYAGENELEALAMNALRVLHGAIESKTYQ